MSEAKTNEVIRRFGQIEMVIRNLYCRVLETYQVPHKGRVEADPEIEDKSKQSVDFMLRLLQQELLSQTAQ